MVQRSGRECAVRKPARLSHHKFTWEQPPVFATGLETSRPRIHADFTDLNSKALSVKSVFIRGLNFGGDTAYRWSGSEACSHVADAEAGDDKKPRHKRPGGGRQKMGRRDKNPASLGRTRKLVMNRCQIGRPRWDAAHGRCCRRSTTPVPAHPVLWARCPALSAPLRRSAPACGQPRG